MRLFKMGSSIQSQTVIDLGAHFYPEVPKDTLEAVDFEDKNPMKNIAPENLSKLVFLGHADTQEYGKYSAKQFAKRLAYEIPKHQRPQVRDIYLVGCEMGLIKNDGHSLAQEIANQLFKQNFINVKIHSITKPENIPGEYMYVEVTTKVGASSWVGNQLGYLTACGVTEEQKAELDRLKAEKNSSSKQITALEKNYHRFIKFQHPQEALDDEKNIFIPNETPQQRAVRTSNNQHTVKKRQAINLLTSRRDYKANKRNPSEMDQAVTELLTQLINQLEACPDQRWSNTVTKMLPHFKVDGFLFYQPEKTTFNLVKALSENNFQVAEAIIDKQVQKHPTANPPKSNQPSTTPASAPTSRLDKMVSQNPIAAQAVLDINYAKQSIIHLREDLDREITSLNAGFFSFFHRFEITTKMQKRDALLQLERCQTKRELVGTATDLMKQTRVMWSLKTTRTKTLITQLANDNFAAFRPSDDQQANQGATHNPSIR